MMSRVDRQQVMAIVAAESLRQERDGEPLLHPENPLLADVVLAASAINRIMNHPRGAIHCLANFYTSHESMRCVRAIEDPSAHCGACK